MTFLADSSIDRPNGPVIEGLVTTMSRDGAMHVAAQGPIWLESGALMFRPYAGSITCENLMRSGEGVFHITDNALLLAEVVSGNYIHPRVRRADHVHGTILLDCTRYWEFSVKSCSTTGARHAMHAEILATGTIQPPSGWNRARHAILEAAILATRVGILPDDQIRSELARLQPLVEKTAGPEEHQAWALILQTIQHRAAVDHRGEPRS
jgi:hypothetical protein